MKIRRLFKTILMLDFITGLLIAIKETFNPKRLLIIHLKKEKLVLDLEVSMHLEDIQTAKKDV